MKYRADIDGLRSVAVIPVILFHLGFSWINGGYYGVDVFFVISGFLITSILCKKIKEDSFSMKDFWIRRVKRILPAVITVITITLIASFFLVFKGDLNIIISDAFAALFSYSNFRSLSKIGNYWGAAAEKSFFLHGWSLSVEEQFYIFYPVFLLLLYRFKQSYIKWLTAIIVLSLVLYLYGSKFHPSYTFYLLPTRAWELASGGLLAVINLNRINLKKEYKSYLAILGVALVVSSYFVFTGSEGVNFHTILPVLGTVLIIAFSSEDNFIGKLLSNKVIVYVGTISYSLYLWHWPITVLFVNYFSHIYSHWQIKVIIVMLTVFFSVLSYHFIENKTRKWEHTPKFVLLSLICLVGFMFTLKSPFVSKAYDTNFNETIHYGAIYDIRPDNNIKIDKNKLIGVVKPDRPAKYNRSFENDGIITSDIAGDPKILVLGDSHGAMWGKVIDEISDTEKIKTSFYTSVGAFPFFAFDEIEHLKKVKGFTAVQRVSYAKKLIENIKKWKPKLLIIACKWNIRKDNDFSKVDDIVRLSKEQGIKILILNQPPEIETIGDRNSAQFLTYLDFKPASNNQYIEQESNNVENSNNTLKERFNKYSNVSFFDVYSHFTDKNDSSKSLIINKSDVLYYDDDHLSYQGTLLLKNDLSKAITTLISEDK